MFAQSVSYSRLFFQTEGINTGFEKFVVVLAGLMLLILIGFGSNYIVKRYFESFSTRYAIPYYLELVNQSNFPSKYEIKADEKTGALSFKISSSGRLLEEVQHQIPLKPGAKPMQSETAERKRTIKKPSKSQSPTKARKQPSKSQAKSKKGGGVGKKAKAGLGIGGAIGGMLVAIGSILPGKIGMPFKRMGGTLKKGGRSVTRVTKAPKRAVSKVSRVQKSAKKIGGAKKKTGGSGGASSAQSGEVDYGDEPYEEGEQDIETYDEPYSVEEMVEFEYETWFLTKSLEPEQSLVVDLKVNPVNPYESGEYSFNVTSTLAEDLEMEYSPGTTEPDIQKADIDIVAVSKLGRNLSYILVGAIIGLDLWVVYLVYLFVYSVLTT